MLANSSIDEKGRVKMSIKAVGGGGSDKPARNEEPPADEEVVEFTLG